MAPGADRMEGAEGRAGEQACTTVCQCWQSARLSHPPFMWPVRASLLPTDSFHLKALRIQSPST